MIIIIIVGNDLKVFQSIFIFINHRLFFNLTKAIYFLILFKIYIHFK